MPVLPSLQKILSSVHLIQFMYTNTWKKYLPVIRLLLKRSAAAEQVVSLNRTDFEINSRLRKPVCSFAVEMEKGRFSTLNKSVPAKDLLDVLMQDDASRALLRQHHYAISLNSNFELNIKNFTPLTTPPVADQKEKEIEASEDEVISAEIPGENS